MKTWMLELTTGEKIIAEAKIHDIYSREMRYNHYYF